jgi:hypothetical protein
MTQLAGVTDSLSESRQKCPKSLRGNVVLSKRLPVRQSLNNVPSLTGIEMQIRNSQSIMPGNPWLAPQTGRSFPLVSQRFRHVIPIARLDVRQL